MMMMMMMMVFHLSAAVVSAIEVPEFVKQVIAFVHLLSQRVELAKHCSIGDEPPLGLLDDDGDPE